MGDFFRPVREFHMWIRVGAFMPARFGSVHASHSPSALAASVPLAPTLSKGTGTFAMAAPGLDWLRSSDQIRVGLGPLSPRNNRCALAARAKCTKSLRFVCV